MPCSDAYGDCIGVTEMNTLANPDNHKKDHSDFCSPFCTCTCCSILVNHKLTPYSVKIPKLDAIPKITYPVVSFFFDFNFYKNIWQPPKIG